MKRLGVNIDHIATLRNARGSVHPDLLLAAKLVIKYGADSITIHLREDRRHIKDRDLKKLSKHKNIPINLVTAVPSIETFENIKKGKYLHSRLYKRYLDANLPNHEIINLNKSKMKKELNSQWEILGEAIQTILRKEGKLDADEKLKDLTRGENINESSINDFISSLPYDGPTYTFS